MQRKRKRILASFSLSKRGSVRVTLERDGGSAVRAWSGSMLRGGHTLTWTLPPKGDYSLVVKATSLNGIASESDAAAQISIAEPSRTVRLPRQLEVVDGVGGDVRRAEEQPLAPRGMPGASVWTISIFDRKYVMSSRSHRDLQARPTLAARSPGTSGCSWKP